METVTLPLIDMNELKPSLATSNELACKIVDAVLSGYLNPLDFLVKKKCIEEALEAAYNNVGVKNCMIEEAQKYNGKGTHLGAKFEVIEAGVKYHFDKTGDPELTRLEAEAGELADKVKQRKEFLKHVKGEGETVLIDDEVITVYPPHKTSTTTVKISLAK
jgi:hypothetical protein